MATEVLKNQKVFFGGYDLTGITNAVSLASEAEAVDATVLGNSTRVNKGGLKTVAASVQGFFDADPYDSALYANVGASDKPLSILTSGTEGTPAYMFKCMIGSYNPSASIGDMFGFSLETAGAGNLIRGTLMENNTAATSTADGTGRQLGAITASQKMYAALHIFSASGTTPTLDVTVESDDNSSFTSAATRITFSQANAVGAQYTTLDGAITDDYWRVSWTIGGTDPSFGFVVVLGIL
jgi:hypothetical protein